MTEVMLSVARPTTIRSTGTVPQAREPKHAEALIEASAHLRKGTQNMGTVTVAGKTIEVDEDGFLANLDDWSMDVAKYFAEVEGIEMTDQHWEVVNFLRDYYKQYQIAPMIKILVKEIGKKLGPDKGNTKYLYELYPGGPAKQACKIAGLPKPTGCV
jgi:tRNA 2-thiouridine synthesizing protein E